MKKIMFAAIAALAITGCSQSEEFDTLESKSEINFNTAVTRGVVLVTADFNNFKAYGYAHADGSFSTTTVGTEIMNGAFTKAGPNWNEENSQKFYWPLTGNVAFFGYSPVESATYSYTSPGYPKVSYKVNTDITNQADFVVASVPDQAKVASVALPFKHALTQVVFKLKGNDTTVTYSVKKVVLKGVKDEGTYNFSETGLWDVTADASTTDYTINLATPVVFQGDATAIALEEDDQLLILMPQAVKTTVEVTYSATKNNVVMFDDTHTANLDVTWEKGKKAAYTLVLQAGEEIKVTGSVTEEWTPKTPADNNIPVDGDLPKL